MDEFIKILLSLSISGTLLLLLILGLKPLYKDRFSRRWQYYIWVIVVLRFLLPFAPDTVNVGSLVRLLDAVVMTDESPAAPNLSVWTNADGREAAQAQPQVQPQTQVPAQGGSDPAASAPVHNPHPVYVCLFFVWAALSLALLVRKITLYQGFIRYVRAGSTQVSDIQILNLLSDCEERMNIKRRVELYQNAMIASPILIGFFHPLIVLPVHELENKDLSHIFVHELVHYRQKDMFYKWTMQLLICVHWFNPLVYLLGKEVNQACELACDEKVLSILGDKTRREYGDTLISFLKIGNTYKSSLASVTLTEGAEQLKERLGAIMNFKKKTKLVAAISCIAAVLLAIGGFSLGAYAGAPGGSYIGLTAAENAALAHAGVLKNETRYCNSWLEYENGRPVCYEVEFLAGNVEYEYEIDMYSGAVIKYDTEYHNFPNPQPADSSTPGNTTPDSTAPDNTAPNNTAPDNTAPDNTAPDNTAPDNTAPGNTAPDNTTPNNTAPGNPADIGPEAAKNAALAHAGIQESETHYCNSWLEYENGRPVYYEVEFVANNIEYEYEIDMYSGAILKYDTEYHDYSRPKTDGTAGSTDIGQDAAKQAAFSHAGLSESQVYHLEIKLDYDDGRLKYEIEFKCNGMKYDYEIDAATGNILKYKCDND